MGNEEGPLSSPSLQIANTSKSGTEKQSFTMFLDFKETGEDQINTQGLSLSNRGQDYKNHSLHSFQADMHGQTCQTCQSMKIAYV